MRLDRVIMTSHVPPLACEEGRGGDSPERRGAGFYGDGNCLPDKSQESRERPDERGHTGPQQERRGHKHRGRRRWQAASELAEPDSRSPRKN